MKHFNNRLLMLCLLGVMVLVGCKSTPVAVSHQDPVLSRIIKASGLDRIDKLTEIQFTFNVRRKDGTVSRHWSWRPHEDKVTLTHAGSTGEDVTLTYIRKDVAAQADTKTHVLMADRWFVNDSFWLMMPLHLSWQDPGKLIIDDHGMANYPLGGGDGRHVTITFPKADQGGSGYSPGDRYDLYLDDQYLIKQWSFHKGGQDKPTLTNTFESYTQLGPFHLALNHENPNGFKLWFSDVKVVTEK